MHYALLVFERFYLKLSLVWETYMVNTGEKLILLIFGS